MNSGSRSPLAQMVLPGREAALAATLRGRVQTAAPARAGASQGRQGRSGVLRGPVSGLLRLWALWRPPPGAPARAREGAGRGSVDDCGVHRQDLVPRPQNGRVPDSRSRSTFRGKRLPVRVK